LDWQRLFGELFTFALVGCVLYSLYLLFTVGTSAWVNNPGISFSHGHAVVAALFPAYKSDWAAYDATKLPAFFPAY
jgi:hypothetical protein